MGQYFISDLHFQHNLVSSLRGFETPEAHDTALIAAINKRVTSKDELFILGDITFNANRKGWQENLSLVDKLNGTKHLVVGNHDRCAPNNTRAYAYKSEFEKHFASVSEFIRLSYEGKPVYLSHYAYDESDPAFNHKNDNLSYEQFRLRDTGHLILHGHTHTKEIITFSKEGTPQINVNVESIGMTPITLAEIASKLTYKWKS